MDLLESSKIEILKGSLFNIQKESLIAVFYFLKLKL